VPLLVRRADTGGDRNFGYLVGDTDSRRAALVDPSPNPGGLLGDLSRLEMKTDYIFVTHGHPDHTAGCRLASERTGAPILGFGDGTIFPLGNLEIRLLHTPGHTADSICLLVGDALFSGDTLFVGKVGGTDLGSGARDQFDSLQRLLTLPDGTRVFPGHDYGTSPESTIGHEGVTNPFLLQPNVAAFIDLKRNWAAYKKKHGIS
jgi:glyoxylase-like metal-dependent hydrolase (beta-lactamase superfamily II)